MTQRLDRLSFSRTGAMSAAIGIVAAVLSGCASATIEDAVPTAATGTHSAPVDGQAGTSAISGDTAAASVETAATEPIFADQPVPAEGPRDTGTYPNLNIKPGVASPQITPQEKTADIQTLTAKRQQHVKTSATAAKGTTDPNLLRKLAATHATDALKTIEVPPQPQP